MTDKIKVNNKSPKTIIKKPRVTEKSANLSDKNVYIFDIAPNVNKNEVKKEIERIYKVKPQKVNIAKTAEKKVFVRGKAGIKSGKIKAYVYLKEGDKIKLS